MEYGKYYILEKEAPAGYEVNPEKMYFEIVDEGKTVEAIMTDENIIVEVPDTRKDDNHFIEILGLIFIMFGMGGIIYVKKN